MVRLMILMLLGAVIMTMVPLGVGIRDDQTREAVAKWFEKVGNEKPKLSRLHFYLQFNFTGNNASVVLVAQPNITSPTGFGEVYVFDGLLTKKPEVNSKAVGRAQGIFAYTSREENAFTEVANYVFTRGEYKGSTLQLIGYGTSEEQILEFSVVGGTGALRLARGTAFLGTLFIDADRETIEVDIFFFQY
ncbi:OLC1v1026741C1 [Oldenlandia corymbosa var. corymbosa]|uniref:Dirigent protein n=1 Tax=Oldenlandia corymbosa var. corymbosa TaxID=529605 RepID=A0AAV1C827_OLDCO|nr:OLC1v1026741C1 [Oldenlandia corymbosa var. corymbosa]